MINLDIPKTISQHQKFMISNSLLPKQTVEQLIPSNVLYSGTKGDDSTDVLKWKIGMNNMEFTRTQYEKMGISIIEDYSSNELLEYNGLFYKVKLPHGWAIKSVNNSSWNRLIDNKGRTRADYIFHLSKYCNGSAYINFFTRYNIEILSEPDLSTGKIKYTGTVIVDGEVPIFTTPTYVGLGSYEKDMVLYQSVYDTCEKYLSEAFPKYNDINAYWEDKE